MSQQDCPPAGDDPAAAPVLDVSQLDVAIGASRILRDVTFAVRPGEFVALLGANGSGKSTLVRTVVGVLPATAGRVRLFGVDLTERRHVPWHRAGYVPQRSTASAGVPATVAEVVASGLLTGVGFRRTPDGADRVRHALEQVGLADRARSAVATLSGGQQQRVLIARALVRDPELLVLDEPLAGVDSASQTAFATTMARLRDRGVTVLVVLHETGPLAPLISRTVVLRHGRVVHDGPPPPAAPGHDDAEHHHQHAHAPDEGADGQHRAHALRVEPGGLP